jgi:L-asparaginase II
LNSSSSGYFPHADVSAETFAIPSFNAVTTEKKRYAISFAAAKCIFGEVVIHHSPWAEQVVQWQMLPVVMREPILRQTSCSGESAGGLASCVRCDVPVLADVQADEL